MRGPDAYRFERYVIPEPNTGCWLWLGGLDRDGYGAFTSMAHGKRRVPAHRFSWTLANGPIPEGLVIDHLCRMPPCVNPAHLRVVTPRTNTLCGMGVAAIHARKTHCPRGHAYAGENLYIIPSTGSRLCRACMAKRKRRKA